MYENTAPTNTTNIDHFRTERLPHILIYKADMNQTVYYFYYTVNDLMYFHHDYD